MTLCEHCNQMVHKHYGQWVHIEDNRTLCFVTRAAPEREKEEVNS